MPIALLLAAIALASHPTEAHKPITSPYTYNDDVFPILRDRCGRCHVSGGVAPMSLMAYKDAFPWGESIRTELVAGHMPPWTVDTAAGTFRNAQGLSARELNVLLTWVTGGNPMGDAERTPPLVALDRSWRMGPPDLVVQVPAEMTVAADRIEQTEEFTLPLPIQEARLVRAVDVMPGNPAIVRSATVTTKASPTPSTAHRAVPERMLAAWVPGDTPVPLDAGTAFQLPANSELVLRVHYKKTWEHERQAMSDRTSVGIYFASGAARDVRAITLSAPQEPSPEAGRAVLNPAKPDGDGGVSFTQSLEEDVQAIAIYPHAALANARVEVTAVRPDGTSAELIRFRPQPDWARRYWLTKPVALPRGTRITVAATFNDTLLPPGAAPIVARPPDPSAVRLTLNVIEAR